MLLSLLFAAGVAHLFPRHIKYLLIAPILGWYVGGIAWFLALFIKHDMLLEQKFFFIFVGIATFIMEILVHHLDFDTKES